MPKRRKYSQEYKQEAVSLAESSEKSIHQVAQELGINATMLGRWCREAEADGPRAFRGQGVSRDEELTALKRELARVRKERDFLKEAATFFAKESQ
jgi:transposase